MHTHGVNQAFRFVGGIWLHRKSRQIRKKNRKRLILNHACATCSGATILYRYHDYIVLPSNFYKPKGPVAIQNAGSDQAGTAEPAIILDKTNQSKLGQRLLSNRNRVRLHIIYVHTRHVQVHVQWKLFI